MTATADSLRRFVVEKLQFGGPAEELTDEFPLIDAGVVDSLGIFQIVMFVEREFGVEVSDEELVPEHFSTVGALATLVDAKLATKRHPPRV